MDQRGPKPQWELQFLVGLEPLGNTILPTRIFSMRQETTRKKPPSTRTKRPVLTNGTWFAYCGHLACII